MEVRPRPRGAFPEARRSKRVERRAAPAGAAGPEASPSVLAGGLRACSPAISLYNTVAEQATFNLTGAGAAARRHFAALQTPRLPVGGRLSFQLSGTGPLLAPKVQGTLRVVDLKLSSTVVGSFAGKVDSDGRDLALQVDSAMPSGSLHGSAKVSLRGDYPDQFAGHLRADRSRSADCGGPAPECGYRTRPGGRAGGYFRRPVEAGDPYGCRPISRTWPSISST